MSGDRRDHCRVQTSHSGCFCHIIFDVSTTPRRPGDGDVGFAARKYRKAQKASQSSNSHCIFASVKCGRTHPPHEVLWKPRSVQSVFLHGSLRCICSFPFPSAHSHSSPPNRQVYHIRLSQEAMRRSNEPFVESAVRFPSILLSSFSARWDKGLLLSLIWRITVT